MSMTASELRRNIYQALDRVLETGTPLQVRRKGRTLKIIAEEPIKKLENMKPRDCLVGDPQDIVDIDWLQEWRP